MYSKFLYGIMGVLAVVYAGTAPSARADFVATLTAQVTVQAKSLYSYEYRLNTTTQSDIPAVNLNIATDVSANLQSITGPTGWDIIYAPGSTVVSWEISDPQFSILPGESAEFTFVSTVPPMLGDYSALGFESDTFSFGSITGTIASPVVNASPEPSSFVLCGLAVIMGIVCRVIRRDADGQPVG